MVAKRQRQPTASLAPPAVAHHQPVAGRDPDRLSLDAPGRRRVFDRLRRIEGQVRGLQRMVEEGRYCPDILSQIVAAQASLQGVAEVLLQEHLRHCVTDAIRSGEPMRAEAIYRELGDLFRKHGR
jgi:DNA-binding FrmR family transcriptional regulator